MRMAVVPEAAESGRRGAGGCGYGWWDGGIGGEYILQRFFDSVLIGFCKERHAAGYCLVSFREVGPFADLHSKYSAVAEDLDQDEDVTGIRDRVASFCC